MPRKSSITTKPTPWRRHLERLLREDRYTLDELIAEMRAKFPAEDAVSRSALGRHSQKFAKFMARTRAAKEMGAAMVTELGEDPHDRGGQLLVEAVTTLATHAAMDANDPDARALSIKEVGELARGARAVLQARKMSLSERREVARVAREQAAEQADAAGRDAGLSAETIAQIRARILQGGA